MDETYQAGLSLARRLRVALPVWAFAAAWFLVPLPAPPALMSGGAQRGPAPSSRTMDYGVRFTYASDQVTFNYVVQAAQGAVQFEVRDPDGRLICSFGGVDETRKESLTFGPVGGFAAGKGYVVRVCERGFVGSYSVDVTQEQATTSWQRLLGLAALFALMALGAQVCLWAGRRGTPACVRLSVVARFGALLLLAPLYALIHETGHAIPMRLLGVYSAPGSDLLGLRGSPHVAYAGGAALAGWQQAAVSLGGPLLPTLAGWTLFLAWRGRRGREVRAGRPFLDFAGSTLLATLLLGHVGLLVPMLRLGTDGDYQGFVANTGWPLPASNALLLAILAANILLLRPVVRHLQVLLEGRKPPARCPAEVETPVASGVG